MNRHDDIRKIMNLMESAPEVTLTEADTSVLDSFTDQVIDYFKAKMEEYPDSATSIVENSSDFVYELLEKQPEDFYSQLVDMGWPKDPSKEFKYLNAKFKEKYGDGFYRFAEKLEDKAHEDDAKAIKPADKKIYTVLGDKLTVKATPKWAAEYLVFYISGQKVMVEDTGSSFPTAVFGKPTLTALKMTKEEFVDWLLAHGIKQKKRPKRSKPTPSLYD